MARLQQQKVATEAVLIAKSIDCCTAEVHWADNYPEKMGRERAQLVFSEGESTQRKGTT